MFSGWLAPMVAISWLFLILRVVHEESLGWVNSPSILVGHSYGGSVITWQTGAFRENYSTITHISAFQNGREGAAMKLMKVVLLYIGVFGSGYLLAYLIYAPHHRTPIDQEWHKQFTEDQNHQRVMNYQNALPKVSGTMDPGELTKILDAQLRIEDLVVKSREAENAKWLPFTPIFTGGLGAALGFLAGLFGKSGGGSTTTSAS
jgi:hypothetical protein